MIAIVDDAAANAALYKSSSNRSSQFLFLIFSIYLINGNMKKEGFMYFAKIIWILLLRNQICDLINQEHFTISLLVASPASRPVQRFQDDGTPNYASEEGRRNSLTVTFARVKDP